MPTAVLIDASLCKRALRSLIGLAVAAGLMGACPALGETLTQALASAYANNPRLQSERARLRGTDENLARAQSGYRPTVNGTIDYTLRSTSSIPKSPGDGTSFIRAYQLNASQPIYNGGSTSSAVKEADATIRAEREVLRETEQQVLLDAITAYMDVIRDRAVLDVQLKNIAVLTQELRQVKARFDVGEVTKTDVEQAKSSLASAQAQSESGKANLSSSSARYALVVGHAPNGIREPGPPNRLLPRNINEAVNIAMASRPSVVQAAYLKDSIDHTISKLYGQLLPQVSLNGQLSSTETSPANTVVDTASLTGHVTVPIYEAGDVRAQIRQQKENRQSLLQNIEQARLQAQSDVLSAWAVLDASRAQLVANQQQVDSAKTALEGVRAELQVGQRTELDVLNAQQTLNNAQVQLITTKHDIVVNSYRVLQVMGRLAVDTLGIGVEQYDVQRHYEDTNGSWWKTTISREVGYVGIEGTIK